jgi:hypothetical protein
MAPNSQAMNYFKPDDQYSQGDNIYQYASSMPVTAADPWGLRLPLSYRQGYDDPPNIPWVDEWGSGGEPSFWMKIHLLNIKHRAYAQVSPPSVLLLLPHASAYLLHYLSNRGGVADFPYLQMLRTSGSAREHFISELRDFAMPAAEILFNNNPTKIVNMDYEQSTAGPFDPDWWLTLQTYNTWGRGIVEKGKGRKICCYRMKWTLDLRDNYEFVNQHTNAGLVWDDEMWELNHYKWAQHFKVEGSRTINITWIKGYKLEHVTPMDVIEGRLKPFPQCQ